MNRLLQSFASGKNGGARGWRWMDRLGVAFNKEENKYVMVIQYGAGVLFAVADKPAGPFDWHTVAVRNRALTVDVREADDAANPKLDYKSLFSPEHLERNKNMKNGAIEAPFLFRKGDWWYLFCLLEPPLSWRRQHLFEGHSGSLSGPRWQAPGPRGRHGHRVRRWRELGGHRSPSACTFGGTDYLIADAYDLMNRGKSKPRVREMKWKDGWPSITLGK
jgi:arabinan endo-1,5-alpha-L-arabinosidase